VKTSFQIEGGSMSEVKEVTYEVALRALNDAVAMRGPGYVDPGSITGFCANVTRDEDGAWVPSCIVGTALTLLGVDAEWLGAWCESDGFEKTYEVLAGEGLMTMTDDAYWLFVTAQGNQDHATSWGEAVVMAHLGPMGAPLTAGRS
jgi:hypothetical protein